MSSHVFKDRQDFPSEEERELASISCRELATILPSEGQKGIKIHLRIEGEEICIEVPASCIRLLMKSLIETAKGNVVALTPIHLELTTQEAADLLNVSRPFLIKLLDQGKIPYHMAGTHRRVLFTDLMDFKRVSDKASEKAMDELIKQAQELDLGY